MNCRQGFFVLAIRKFPLFVYFCFCFFPPGVIAHFSFHVRIFFVCVLLDFDFFIYLFFFAHFEIN